MNLYKLNTCAPTQTPKLPIYLHKYWPQGVRVSMQRFTLQFHQVFYVPIYITFSASNIDNGILISALCIINVDL